MNTAKFIGSAIVGSALLLSSASIAFAQTSSTTSTSTYTSPSTNTTGTTGTTSTGTTVTTPGTPNTGAGGDAGVNMLLLAVSALAVAAGGTYLARKVALQ